MSLRRGVSVMPSAVALVSLRSLPDGRQAGRWLARRAPSPYSDARPREPLGRRYQLLFVRWRRRGPRAHVHPAGCPGALQGTPSTPSESHVRPSHASRRRHRQADPAHTRSRRRWLRFLEQSDREASFDTGLAQDAIAQPSGVLLGVNGHPDFLAGRGMPRQQVAPFSRPDLDESCSLQRADHLGPRHGTIVNLALGYVKAQMARVMRCPGP